MIGNRGMMDSAEELRIDRPFFLFDYQRKEIGISSEGFS